MIQVSFQVLSCFEIYILGFHTDRGLSPSEIQLQDDDAFEVEEVELIDVIVDLEDEETDEMDETEVGETEENGGEELQSDVANVIEQARQLTATIKHVRVHKYRVDGKFHCGFCVTTTLQRLDMMFAQVHTIHDVMSAETANKLYETEKCEVCQIGLMSIFNRKDCPLCQCDDCTRLEHKCLKCACDSLEYHVSVRYIKIR